MKKALVVFLALLAASLSLSAADIYIKSKTHTDAMSMMGQTIPAKDVIQEQWLGEGRMATVTSEQITLVDMTKKKLFIITPASKSYVEADLPFDFAKILPPGAEGMASMMKYTVTVVPTNEKKKIGNWNCTAYTMTVSMMGMVNIPMKIWATTDLPFDANKYMGLMAEMTKGQMRLDDAAVKEMAKIKGIQVASETTAEIMGAKMHSTMETLEIAVKAAPASVWTVPAGFTKRSTMTMEELQKQR